MQKTGLKIKDGSTTTLLPKSVIIWIKQKKLKIRIGWSLHSVPGVAKNQIFDIWPEIGSG